MKILTPQQSKFLDNFFKTLLKNDFYLTGGTALSVFYLHHRKSEDIDLFTVNQTLEFNEVNMEMLKIIHSFSAKIEKQVVTPTFLQYILKINNSRLKVDIVKDVPIHFGEIKSINNIRVDSLENIAVGKLLALFGRADAKDFVDLYFLLGVEKKLSFNHLFKLGKKKDVGLHELYLAEMILQIEKIEHFPRTFRKFDRKRMIKYYLDLSDSLFKKIKPV